MRNTVSLICARIRPFSRKFGDKMDNLPHAATVSILAVGRVMSGPMGADCTLRSNLSKTNYESRKDPRWISYAFIGILPGLHKD